MIQELVPTVDLHREATFFFFFNLAVTCLNSGLFYSGLQVSFQPRVWFIVLTPLAVRFNTINEIKEIRCMNEQDETSPWQPAMQSQRTLQKVHKR